ncbi:hypothetical protein SEA_REINDEER_6 [Mycobacterium phage Reindeer]|uniref:Uncharacterized protein n=1 Tax=Mycobacterium phage Reindeer TaxID=2762283 RepID=A0A7G8LHU4_9CAUD|nr:hypothetical protein J4U05_gp006 [Mycobacterium phage Reindeer]QNJ56816.1 hypothetical protein SEA_REINDEER_6 [Mycobacterium phage Reindeer]
MSKRESGSWFAIKPYHKMPEMPPEYDCKVYPITSSAKEVLVTLERGQVPVSSRRLTTHSLHTEEQFAHVVRVAAHELWDEQRRTDQVKEWLKEKVWET